MRVVICALLIATVGACTDKPGAPQLTCTAQAQFVLDITAHNAATGASILSQATVTTHRQDGYGDAVVVRSLDPRVRIEGFAGTYDVRVTAPGFTDWVKTGVVVPLTVEGGCEPRLVTLDAELKPLL